LKSGVGPEFLPRANVPAALTTFGQRLVHLAEGGRSANVVGRGCLAVLSAPHAPNRALVQNVGSCQFLQSSRFRPCPAEKSGKTPPPPPFQLGPWGRDLGLPASRANDGGRGHCVHQGSTFPRLQILRGPEVLVGRAVASLGGIGDIFLGTRGA